MSLYIYENDKKYFHYDNWLKHRSELLSYYPSQGNKLRIDMELVDPHWFIKDVSITHNPHQFCDARSCFYACDEWSTIFDIHEYTHPNGKDAVRILLESNNHDPVKGERVILFCSSSALFNEPWGRNPSLRFAFFRNRFWLVSYCELLQPFTDWWAFRFQYPNSCVPINAGYFSEPTYIHEQNHSTVEAFLEDIIFRPNDFYAYSVFADWLDEQNVLFAHYLQKIILDGFSFKKLELSSFLKFSYSQRPKNIRTAIFLLVCLLQNNLVRGWSKDYAG